MKRTWGNDCGLAYAGSCEFEWSDDKANMTRQVVSDGHVACDSDC